MREIWTRVREQGRATRSQALAVVFYVLVWRVLLFELPILVGVYLLNPSHSSGQIFLYAGMIPIVAFGATGVCAEVVGSIQTLLFRRGDDRFGMSYAFWGALGYAVPRRQPVGLFRLN